VLDALKDVAELYVKEKENERAIELLEFVLNHPSTDDETRSAAQHILARESFQASARATAAAQASGSVRPLEEAVAEVLQVFRPSAN